MANKKEETNPADNVIQFQSFAQSDMSNSNLNTNPVWEAVDEDDDDNESDAYFNRELTAEQEFNERDGITFPLLSTLMDLCINIMWLENGMGGKAMDERTRKEADAIHALTADTAEHLTEMLEDYIDESHDFGCQTQGKQVDSIIKSYSESVAPLCEFAQTVSEKFNKFAAKNGITPRQIAIEAHGEEGTTQFWEIIGVLAGNYAMLSDAIMHSLYLSFDAEAKNNVPRYDRLLLMEDVSHGMRILEDTLAGLEYLITKRAFAIEDYGEFDLNGRDKDSNVEEILERQTETECLLDRMMSHLENFNIDMLDDEEMFEED